jgi:hypothetical protein
MRLLKLTVDAPRQPDADDAPNHDEGSIQQQRRRWSIIFAAGGSRSSCL